MDDKENLKSLEERWAMTAAKATIEEENEKRYLTYPGNMWKELLDDLSKQYKQDEE